MEIAFFADILVAVSAEITIFRQLEAAA